MLSGHYKRALFAMALVAGNTGAFGMTTPQSSQAGETGRAWLDNLTCIGCLAAGGVAIYSGAAAWAVLLASPAATTGVVATCVGACVAAYGT